jgi:hypothetical protein
VSFVQRAQVPAEDATVNPGNPPPVPGLKLLLVSIFGPNGELFVASSDRVC